MPRPDMHHLVHVLQRSLHHKELCIRRERSVPLVKAGVKDSVCNAGFIFDGEKDETIRRLWTLPSDDAPRNPDDGPMPQRGEFDCPEHF